MKIRTIILKRLAEFVFLMAVELGTTFLLDHLSGGYIIFDIAALLVATVVFDALAQKWEAKSCSKPSQKQLKKLAGRRPSITTKRKSYSQLTSLFQNLFRYRH
ncbi:membrane protein [gut metagenome]|uniref:Membrane protein n=1 Tax=gut metagenome TaxID=749906 RepID=J9FJW0_9ZZZZ